MKQKKRNLRAYIDGENIPEKYYEAIRDVIDKIGVVDCMNVYGLQKDKHTQAWTKRSRRDNNLHDKRLYGRPTHNKVDKKMSKDIMKDITDHKNTDIVVIVASDAYYRKAAIEARAQGKRVVGIGEEKTPNKLRSVYNEFWEISIQR